MKVIIIPIYRTVVVLFSLLVYPILTLINACVFLWDFNTKNFISVNKFYTEEFIKENTFCKMKGYTYFVYKTPIDYILNKKTYKKL